eukprot:Opistho-2@81228
MSSKGKKSGAKTAGAAAEPPQGASQAEPVTEEPLRIDLYDAAGIKNGLDDTIRAYVIEDLGYNEDHRYTDLKLALCGIASLFSAVALVYNFFVPFPDCKPVLATCAIGYFLITGFVTVLSMFYEKNTIIVAREPGTQDVLEVESRLPRFDENYSVTLHYRRGGASQGRATTQTVRSVGTFIRCDGQVAEDAVRKAVGKLFKTAKGLKEKSG